MERVQANAELREPGKKGLNRRLRKGGRVPAVLYGRGGQALPLTVNSKEFTLLLKQSGMNALIDLTVAGSKDSDKLVAMVKDYQTDFIRRVVTHIDLLKIDLTQKLAVRVPVHVIGKSIGIENGGLLEYINREIEVRCLPTSIPEKIEVDITAVDVGHSLHVRDVKLPEGVEAVSLDMTIVAVVAPAAEEAAPVAAAEAAPAAGAAPAAPGAAPAADKDKKADAKPEKK